MSAVVHEYAHGWTALQFGDDTAKRLGRLSFNPLKHIDPFSTVLLPIVLIMLGLPAIAIAKPVPINPYNLKNPKKNMIWIAAAGPASNFLIALVCAMLMHWVGNLLAVPAIYFLGLIILINMALAVFNLIPIPPLDGSRIVMGLLPRKQAILYSRVEKYGLVIILVLVMTTNVIPRIIVPVLQTLWLTLGLPIKLFNVFVP